MSQRLSKTLRGNVKNLAYKFISFLLGIDVGDKKKFSSHLLVNPTLKNRG